MSFGPGSSMGAPVFTYDIIIDNTAGAIQYKGSNWTIVGPFADGYGVPVYNGSQSMAQGADHEFTYKFLGTAITVFGSWDYTDNPLPVCEVDGSAIAGPTSVQVDVRTRQMHDQADNFSQKLLLATNQMPLCSAKGLDDVNQHELVVRTGSDINTRLVFDYLVFTTRGVNGYQSVNPGTFPIYASMVSLLGEWQSSAGRTVEEVPNLFYDRNSTMATAHNASISFGFYGSKITMVGILDNAQGASATGRFTIDDKVSTSFSLSNTINTRETLFQQTIFTSERLPLDFHRILVQWDGDVGQQRFGFTNFYLETVDNPTLPGATTASTISPSATSSATQSSTSSPQIPASPTSPPVAVVVGGVVGGLVAVTAVIMFLWFLRRRRRVMNASQEYSQSTQGPDPHDDLQRPVQTDPLLGPGVEPFHPPAESVWTESSSSGAVTLSVAGTSIQSSLALLKEKQSQVVWGGEMHSNNLADSYMVESDRTEFLMHQDSGLRLSANTREGRRVVEVPPEYTA